MWLSYPKQAPTVEEPGEIGRVTVGGNPAGVYLAGERRNVPLFAPGGYYWRPAPGDAVLVMKAGTERAPCLVGREEPDDGVSLKPGEVLISAHPEAGILLGRDGSIRLFGDIYQNGNLVKPPAPEPEPEPEAPEPEKNSTGKEGENAL